MSGKAEHQRVAFSPAEFAALFGKSQTWGYRQIYSGKIKAITDFGRIQIPAAEVERVLASAGVYTGLPKAKMQSKEGLQSLKPKLVGAWQSYLDRRREAPDGTPEKPSQRSKARKDQRAEALDRLTRGKLRRQAL